MKRLLPLIFSALFILSAHNFALASATEKMETWRMMELRFTASADYSSTGAGEVWMDVEFIHNQTRQSIVRPAFWDGGNSFIVRFAPTLKGRWSYQTKCPQDASLDNISGEFKCSAYRGDLEIYRRGFVRCEKGKKYMTYADGTPFFYLGDTHWGMLTEEIDQAGPHAGTIATDSHFKYIIDRRVEQGFTVYQSEPIGAAFNVEDGEVNASDIAGFQLTDRYFDYIAQAGLTHANAQFFFVAAMSPALAADDRKLEILSRYWVARYGAYPVMWTLAQECDNDFYRERGDQQFYDFSSNPWVKVAEYLHKYDAYSHPLSAHQENAYFTTVTGRGVDFAATNSDGGGASAFASKEVAERTGHNWWAAQWSTPLTAPVNAELVRDYWEDDRPAINYEGRYCGLWTKDFGARVQGWVAFLSGFMGYGYGAIDMWLYKSLYNIDVPSHDGIEEISCEDKLKHWSEAIEYPSAHQMTYMRNFLEQLAWWKLAPVLPGSSHFSAKSSAYAYARGADVELLYLFSHDRNSGTINHLEPHRRYDLVWYNPRSDKMLKTVKIFSDEKGSLTLPDKPDEQDWVAMVKH